MHFFYLDETGCTGADLGNAEQPIFVIGGISVTDEGWRTTSDRFLGAFENYFHGQVPAGFELHAADLVNGQGHFANAAREQRNSFVHTLLDIIAERKHAIHLIGIDKAKLAAAVHGGEHEVIDCAIPYMLGFNYIISYIERYVRKGGLGASARGMIILDKKEIYQKQIDDLTRYRRYSVPNVRKLKRIVEFSYPVDSVRHPLVQVSDLVIFLTRKFLECECGYRSDWPVEAKNFYASCYDKIVSRVHWTTLINTDGGEELRAHELLKKVQATPRTQWRSHYQL